MILDIKLKDKVQNTELKVGMEDAERREHLSKYRWGGPVARK